MNEASLDYAADYAAFKKPSLFQKNLNRLAGRAMREFGLIQEGDRVLVALSGGKDSLVLLRWLAERRAKSPRFQLTAAHLDLGYEKPEDHRPLAGWAADLGIDYVFERVDYGLAAHSEVNRENPCFLCARLRRRRLFEIAGERNCAKIALGHHRDDALETFLLNILYSGETSTMLPAQVFFKGLFTIIRPFYLVPEALIARLARRWKPPIFNSGCPSNGRTKRAQVKNWLRELAQDNDKIPGNVFRAMFNCRPDYLPARPPTPAGLEKKLF